MKKTVVIIDDSKFLVSMLQDFFQDVLQFDVLATGNNGIQAIELFRQYKPDLLTLDLTMPIKDGPTALGEIITEFPTARILIISALNGNSILECIKKGASGYIEKPLRFDDEDFRKEFSQTLEEVFIERVQK